MNKLDVAIATSPYIIARSIFATGGSCKSIRQLESEIVFSNPNSTYTFTASIVTIVRSVNECRFNLNLYVRNDVLPKFFLLLHIGNKTDFRMYIIYIFTFFQNTPVYRDYGSCNYLYVRFGQFNFRSFKVKLRLNAAFLDAVF